MARRLWSVLCLTVSVGCASVPRGGVLGDSDGDGVSDSQDECPDAAEEQGGDGDGCPDAPRLSIEDGMIEIQGKIVFALSSAELAPQNAKLLALLAQLLAENHSIELVQVEGHTDTTGDEAFNKQLSLERAETVVTALVARGVEPGRLRARGFGASQPQSNNTSLAGRARNRRVELRVVD